MLQLGLHKKKTTFCSINSMTLGVIKMFNVYTLLLLIWTADSFYKSKCSRIYILSALVKSFISLWSAFECDQHWHLIEKGFRPQHYTKGWELRVLEFRVSLLAPHLKVCKIWIEFYKLISVKFQKNFPFSPPFVSSRC